MSDDAPGTDDGPVTTRRRHTFADLYHERTNFQFIDRSWRWAVLSGVLILVGLGALAVRGLNLSIEFEGGTAWQVEVEGFSPSVGEVRDELRPLGLADAKVAVLEATGSGGQDDAVRVQAEVLEDPVGTARDALADAAGLTPADVQVDRRGDAATWSFSAEGVTEDDVRSALGTVEDLDVEVTIEGADVTVEADPVPPSPVDVVTTTLAGYAGAEVSAVTVSTVGPTWGEQVTRKALQALVIFFVLVIVYLSFRFEWKMALAAVAAVVHDIVVTVGFYALFQFEVTPATVTAFLTILGFSLYDTVVVFDKVNENTASLLAVGRTTYSEMVNRSLNQVLMRSLSTSLVALLPVASLLVVGSWLLGAVALQEFALALFAGLFIGTYSSLFVATPLLAAWKEREDRYVALRRRSRRRRGDEPAEGPTPEPELEGVGATAKGGVASAVPPRPRRQRRRKRR